MSGGVDSTVAASLLQEQGYHVEGLFMKNWDEDDDTEYCTARQDLADAARVCETLGVPLHTANFAAEYWDDVFESFLAEYMAGRTPNPDVACNREIKFKQFVDYAAILGADYIATGHYARWHQGHLCKGVDSNKDQTYFLQDVPIAQLKRCLFPLGELTKAEVRQRALQLGLHNHDRKDSTGICFIGERRFADFISQYATRPAGKIVDTQDRTIGHHSGLHQFTCGQRQGLNIGGVAGRAEAPWYVLHKDLGCERLVVTQDQTMLMGGWLRASEPNWLTAVELPMRCSAKVRYRQADQACTVSAAADGRVLVKFDAAQRALNAGQYVAFYQAEQLLGGARIDVVPNQFQQLKGVRPHQTTETENQITSA